MNLIVLQGQICNSNSSYPIMNNIFTSASIENRLCLGNSQQVKLEMQPIKAMLLG